MNRTHFFLAGLLLAGSSWALPPPLNGPYATQPIMPGLDTLNGDLREPPPPMERGRACDGIFKCYWLTSDGTIYSGKVPDALEMSATEDITLNEHYVGSDIIRKMMAESPLDLFHELTRRGTIGFFTFNYATTIFPEYQAYRDRPECSGTCSGACSNTCTGDGRKYDSLAGLGGTRGTCVEVNYMCKASDPYNWQYSVLVHEVAHTVHQYALPHVRPGGINYWDEVWFAWNDARNRGTWDVNSYAMSNHLEYFAEGTAVFFNVNRHPSSSGGMNGCGRSSGFCQSESEARSWLESQDPRLFEAISYTFTNYRPHIPSGLTICP